MKNKSGITFGLFSGVFWGLGLTISAYIFSLYNVSPFVVAFVHDFISIFILAAILLIKYKKIDFKIFTNIKNISVIIGALLAGPIGMQCNLYPAVSVILAIVFLKHKVSKKTIVGIALIIAGIFAQSYTSEQVNSFYIGFLFALICAVAWGSESVLSSYAMSNNLTEIETLLIRQVTSFLAYLVIVLFNGFSVSEVADVKLGGLIFIFVLSNMISYIAYYMSINRLKPAKATGLNVSYVVWTVVFSAIFLGIGLSTLVVITSLVIMLGVYIIIKD